MVSVVVAGLRPRVPGAVHQPADPARAGWIPGTVCSEGTELWNGSCSGKIPLLLLVKTLVLPVLSTVWWKLNP